MTSLNRTATDPDIWGVGVEWKKRESKGREDTEREVDWERGRERRIESKGREEGDGEGERKRWGEGD